MSEATITKDRVMPLLLEACPNAQEAWREHLAWWKEEKAGDFNDVNVIARHAVDSYANGDTTEFEALFAVIERILQDGDREARSLALRGVLEDIQTISSHRSFGSEPFRRC